MDFTKLSTYLTIILCLTVSTVHAQHYNFKQYSVADGLAQSQVYALLQDSRGYIWMGTRGGGLNSFDGIKFETYTNKDGLNSNYILSLFEDSKGTLWIGTDQGLNTFNGLNFEQIALPNVDSFSVESILEDSNGKIWFGTSHGLYSKEDEGLVHFDCDDVWSNDNINDLLQSADGKIWGASNQGLFKISKNEIITYTKSDGLAGNIINSIEQDAEGILWISVYGEGVQLFDGLEFTRLSDLKPKIIHKIKKDQDGNMWMASLYDGVALALRDSRQISYLNEENGLASNHIRCIIQDDWKNIWIGTSGAGIAKYGGQQFQHFSSKNGLPGKQVYSLLEDKDKSVWMGVGDKGVCRFNQNQKDQFEQDSILNHVKVKVLFEDDLYRVWAGTEGKGLYVFSQDSTWNLSIDNGLSSNWIKAITQNSKGEVYLGTSGGGINVLSPNNSSQSHYAIEFINRQRGLGEDRITDLVIDQFDRLWYSTQSSGIGVILNDGNIVNLNESHGLVSNSVRSLEIDSLGWLWIGTAGAGISKMNLLAETLELDSLKGNWPLTSDNIYFLQFDSKNNLWVGSESGVDKVILDEERNPIEIQHFGKQEGFNGIETCSNSSISDNDGNLWFGTIDGLCLTNPSSNYVNERAPLTRIINVNLFYQALIETEFDSTIGDWGLIQDTLILKHTQNHLSFDFIGINQHNPEKVSYSWKLNGLEEEWSPRTFRTNATFGNLNPGEYSFQLLAYNEEGKANEQAETVHFRILAPYWQKLWFKIGYWSLLVLIVLLIFLIRVRNVKIKAREKNAKLRMEMDVLELEQKALRLQMNPHFIFNSLNSIQGLMAKKDDKSARLYLSKFSKLMRQTLENSREDRVSIEEEIEALKHYLELEKFTHEGKFDFQIECAFDSCEYEIPPLIIQPFAENAIIHGLIPLGGEGMLKINFSLDGAFILIKISDNGVGRKKASEIKSQKSQYHKSTGLQVTQERLDMLQNGNEARKSIMINDLLDKDGNSLGTEVCVWVRIED